MKRSAGKCLFFLSLFQGLMWIGSVEAKLEVSVDRREIAMGETLRLTLLGDSGERLQELDLFKLNGDWEIISQSSATNARFINGQKQVTKTLELELAPLREGTLSIPPMKSGGRYTTPISVRVNPEAIASFGDADVIFESSVDQTSLYVQAELIMTITLQQAVNLDGGEISDFDVPNATTESLERRSFQRRVGNRTWLVTELRYAVYPQKSGTLNIPAITFTAREVQPGRSLLGARLGRKIRLNSEPLIIDVKSVPKAFSGNVWLPAKALSLEETWSMDPESLTVGDSTTRTLTLVADGLQGSQIPPLDTVQGLPNIPELKFYPDKESIDQKELSNGLQGQRIQSEALVPGTAGNWMLPEIRLPWWNTETDQPEVATILARPVRVSQVPSISIESPSMAAPMEHAKSSIKKNGSIVFGAFGWILAALLGFLLWRTHKKPLILSATNSGRADSDKKQLKKYLVQIRAAVLADDLKRARSALLDWGSLFFGQPIRSLSHLQSVGSFALGHAASNLDQLIYSHQASEWQPMQLLEILRKEPKPNQTSMPEENDLRLYPNQ